MGARDYSSTAASNLSVGGISIAEGMARASVNNAMRSQLADTANLLLDQGGGVTTTGSSNVYLLDLPTQPTAYADNLNFVCKFHAAVTGASTININGLGVKPLKKLQNGVPTALATGDAPAGQRAVCFYSTSDNCVLMLQSLPTFTAGGSGAISWPIIDRMKQQVYLLDYIPVQHHPHILDGTAATPAHANFYDCSDAIDAAMASVSQDFGNFYDAGPEILFPLGWMYFSRTIEMKKTMTFTGHGQGARNGYGTTLKFAQNITGITVNSLTTYQGSMIPPLVPVASDPANTQGADGSTLRHLRLESLNGGTPNFALNMTGGGPGNGVGHGIWLRGRANIEHCGCQFFPQHGFYVRATAQPPNDTEGWSIYGNANNTYIAHCYSVSNGGCGLMVEGSDTNGCTFIGMDCSSNRLSGIHESSFIGPNVHINPHVSGNGYDAFCSYATTPGVTQSAGYLCKDEWRANNKAYVWTSGVVYHERDYVRNVGNLYECTRGGSPATIAPTGTAATIGGGGYLLWAYVAADAGIQIPPTGHAQSAAVWEFVSNTAGPIGSIETDPSTPPFPYLIDGITLKNYRTAYQYWFEDSGNILMAPYVEGTLPSKIESPALVIGGNATFSADSDGGKIGTTGTGALQIKQSLEVPSKLDTTDNARNFVTTIGRAAGESLGFQVAATTASTANASLGSQFGYVWDEASGCWLIQYARSATPQLFTTSLNNITNGRTAPIASGATMFQSGMWVGSRFHNAVITTPSLATAAEYAAGDVLFNQTPTGVSAPSGWICTTSGAVATAAWVANTAYARGALATNDTGKSYVCIDPGISFGTGTAWASSHAYLVTQRVTNGGNTYVCITSGTSASSGGPTGTGFAITDGTAVWDYLSPTIGTAHPWAASTFYAVTDTVTNDGGKFYVCTSNGTSASSGGPTGTGAVTDGAAQWQYYAPTAMVTTGPAGTGTYILDGTAAWAYKAPFVFTPFDGKLSQQTISDGLAFTLTPGTSPRNTLYTGTMLADRAVGLAVSPTPVAGSFFRITRTATGAFNLNVGTGPLKALIANSWCEVTYSGSAWYLSSYGLL